MNKLLFIEPKSPRARILGWELRRFVAVLWLLCLLGAGAAFAVEPFISEQPTMSVGRVRPGMRGYALTVLKGTKPVRLPLEIVGVVPQKGTLKNAIMIKMLSDGKGPGSVAQGMSGSPVYVGGKLVGAVSGGWEFSDHKVALVMPIEEMCGIFSRPDRPAYGASYPNDDRFRLASVVRVSGLGDRAVARLGTDLKISLESAPYASSGELKVEYGRFAPGEAVAVLLAWGDVEMAAVGTVTATSKDGRFLAFGHPFMERGAVNFPVARARIYDTLYSQVFPFKLGSPVALLGTATQDRAAGVGGRTGYFTPSVSASLTLRDLDVLEGSVPKRDKTRFRVVPDAFLASRLIPGIFSGLIDDRWGRKGQGTAKVTLRVEGKGLEGGWTRTNVFFSESDIGSELFQEIIEIVRLIFIQPFKEIQPLGFDLDVSVSQEPRVLLIEDVKVVSEAQPGDEIEVEVVLRPWRRPRVTKRFTLSVPSEAEGACELVVRGGGAHPLSQLAVDGGWKTIDDLGRMLSEIAAMDANNELIVELVHDQSGVKAGKDGKKAVAELLPEEKEFLSETKERRLKEGTLRISRSDYVVDGFMKRLININTDNE